MLIEAAVDTLEQALDAERAGADRVELCANLDVGGTTPSAGVIGLAVDCITVPVFVMVRPRGGDFTASPLEFDVMRREIVEAKRLGADGIVLGILTEEGEIDVRRTRELVEVAAPLPVTFHMAFDRAADRDRAIADLLDTGVKRLLTNGGGSRAVENLDAIRLTARRLEGRVTVVAGGGVVADDVPRLAEAGLREIHARLTSKARVRAVVSAARSVSS